MRVVKDHSLLGVDKAPVLLAKAEGSPQRLTHRLRTPSISPAQNLRFFPRPLRQGDMRDSTHDVQNTMTLDVNGQAPSENLNEIQTDTGRDQSLDHGGRLQDVQEKAEIMLGTTNATLHDMTSCLLDFLSNASNDTLVACLVGLGAATYLILGRVGLVLIGVLGGIILQATWEGNPQDTADDAVRVAEMKRRRDVGLDIVQRVLYWRDGTQGPTGDQDVIDVQTKSFDASKRPSDFLSFQPTTGAALSNLTDAVIDDYVRYSFYSHSVFDVVN